MSQLKLSNYSHFPGRNLIKVNSNRKDLVEKKAGKSNFTLAQIIGPGAKNEAADSHSTLHRYPTHKRGTPRLRVGLLRSQSGLALSYFSQIACAMHIQSIQFV